MTKTFIAKNPPSPQLAALRARLQHLYGSRLARIVLFGSRARGEAHRDSDYDVAIFLHEMNDRWAEFDRIDPIIANLLIQDGMVVQILPYDERRYHDPSSLMRAIREEGVPL